MDFSKFTPAQALEISKVIQWIQSLKTNIASNCQVDQVEMYIDELHNFYISFVQTMTTGSGSVVTCEYYKIVPSGERLNMKDLYETQSQIVAKLEKCQPINTNNG